jgi:asparagine synthase (glutamine-hydrolysing)
MCGLAGFLDLTRGSSPEQLQAGARRMAEAIRHRGPDDSGEWVDATAGLALGFRRLSILDLSPEGHQPMVSASGRYVLTFNGEVYNHADLRQRLAREGFHYPFRGHSDTEVMLAAFEHWGLERAVAEFVGMFAFVLWDRRARTLHLVRDRLGEKPLYYGRVGHTFLFGSEVKALRAHPAWAGEINRDALVQYLRRSCVPAPHCIYKGFSKLPPACILTVSPDDNDVGAEPVPYWSAREAAARGLARPFPGSAEEAVDALARLLSDTVRDRMVADVPLGAFLSGGVDSSLVVALMQAQSARPVRTYTIGFAEEEYDESGYARAVADHLGTEHTEMQVTPAEMLAVIPRMAAIYGEPFADASQIPTFLVAQLARRSVTVSLSGDGGDEVFGGYTRYARVASLWHAVGWVPARLRPQAVGALQTVPEETWDRRLAPLRRVLPGRLGKYLWGWKVRKLAEALNHAGSPESFYGCLMSKWDDAPHVVLGAADPGEGGVNGGTRRPLAFGDALQAADMVSYLPDDILTKVDRATMAVSLESRAPLLDHRLVEFAFSLAPSLKSPRRREKWVLRRLLARYVPPHLTERPKMGFCLPIRGWLQGPLRDWAEGLLDEGRLRREGFFDAAAVRRKWHEHLCGRHDWQRHLWDVLMFQRWLETEHD